MPSSRGPSRPRDIKHTSLRLLLWQTSSLPPARPGILCNFLKSVSFTVSTYLYLFFYCVSSMVFISDFFNVLLFYGILLAYIILETVLSWISHVSTLHIQTFNSRSVLFHLYFFIHCLFSSLFQIILKQISDIIISSVNISACIFLLKVGFLLFLLHNHSAILTPKNNFSINIYSYLILCGFCF